MPPSTGWPIRTSYAELKPASWFLAHPLNLAIHPQAQQDYLAGSLDELGWVKPVIVNKRTSPEWGPEQGVETLLDGHARIREALRAGDETPVPLDWVDLPPNLEEIALMVLDQMVTYRVLDKEKLALLAASAKPQNTALQEMCAAMCAKEGLLAPIDPRDEWQGMPEFIHEDQTSAYRAIIHFATEADLRDFEALIGQKIPDNTHAIWFPKAERDVVRHERYINEQS